MKRVLAVTIALTMIFTMAACGEQPGETVVQDNREAYENLQLSLGPALPSITMWGTYYLNDISDAKADEGMVASYYTELDSEPDYDFYQWEKGDASLREFAAAEIEKRGGDVSNIESSKFNTWEIEGDYEYYYASVYSEFEGKPYIVQCYFFEDTECFIGVECKNECFAVDTGVNGCKIHIPVSYEEASYTSTTPDELVAAYYIPDQSKPMVFIYDNDTDDSLQTIVADYVEKYTIIKSELFDFKADGKTYTSVYVDYIDEQGDQALIERAYIIDFGSEKLTINFLVFEEDPVKQAFIQGMFMGVRK